MKKLILSIFCLLALTSPCFATQYNVHALTTTVIEPAGFPSKRELVRLSNGDLWCFYSIVDTTRKLYAIKSTDGGATWTGNIQISTGADTCYYASAAVDTSNNIHVVYTQEASGVENLHYIYYNGSIWTGEETLTTDGYSHQYCPALAIDSANKLHLTWYSMETPQKIYYKNKASGGSWSVSQTLRGTSGDVIYPGGSEASGMPSIFVDKNNVVHISFGVKASADTYVRLRYLKSTDGGSNWSAIETLSADTEDAYDSCIVCDEANGYPRIVWSSWGTYEHIYFIKWNGSSWDTAVDLTSGYTYNQESPSIAIDGSDNLTVLWFGWDNPNNCWQISRILSSNNGASWGSISYLTSESWNNQRYPISINARWPVIGSVKTNIPLTGYTYIWANNDAYLKIDNDSVTWEKTPNVKGLTGKGTILK